MARGVCCVGAKSTYLNGRLAAKGSSPRADKTPSAEARILALAAMLMAFRLATATGAGRKKAGGKRGMAPREPETVRDLG